MTKTNTCTTMSNWPLRDYHLIHDGWRHNLGSTFRSLSKCLEMWGNFSKGHHILDERSLMRNSLVAPLCTIFTILLTLWNSEQKNRPLRKLFCFSSDFNETWWGCSTHHSTMAKAKCLFWFPFEPEKDFNKALW